MSLAIRADDEAIRLTAYSNADQQIKLEASKKTLAQVLDTLAKNTGVIIHFSGLPDAPVSVACAGSNIKQLLECLLDKQADMVFRYAQATATAQPAVLEEIWVFGAAKDGKQGTLKNKADKKLLMQASNNNDTGKLLAMAQVNDPGSRADAIGALAVQTPDKDPLVRKTLVSALSDSSAEVRAQAVFALSKYDDADATDGLASALQDEDVSVRLMVVDSAGHHPDLLQQALVDGDETVRLYAASKLEALKTQ
ncbi:MAG: HEAT repeat domain-containing protein [Methylovulum sp.]|nr:HEAT repeat domain-containing protein [Methylovulum sp.]